MIRVVTLLPKGFGSNTYFVTDGKESFVVDPSVSVLEAKAVLGEEMLPPKAILITHGHFDHIDALPEWYEAYAPAVYIGREDAPMLSSGYLNAHEIFYGQSKTYEVPHTALCGGSELSLCGERVFADSYPGHSPGSLVYRLSDIAFVGDLIFDGGGFGRYDLPGGSGTALYESLTLARAQLVGYKLYPGHGSAFSL